MSPFNDTPEGQTNHCPSCEALQRKLDEASGEPHADRCAQSRRLKFQLAELQRKLKELTLANKNANAIIGANADETDKIVANLESRLKTAEQILVWAKQQEDLPPKYVKIINDDFWNLFGDDFPDKKEKL